MDVKEKLTAFWAAMQAWVGASPVKSTVLALVCFGLGYLIG